MSEPLPILDELPMARPAGRPFDPPAELTALRAAHPVARLRFPDGHEGWLVTGHAPARVVASDPRFSARDELQRSPMPGAPVMEIPPAAPGMFIGMDPPDHTRYRRMLTGRFTVRRMRLLTARIEEVTKELLDAMERQGGPVDLVRAYAQPVPGLVICEMLGVPYADRAMFQRTATLAQDNDASAEVKEGAFNELGEYMYRLVQDKRADPTDDVLGELAGSGELTDEELTGIGVLLLAAAFDTTANMIALGTFALLAHPAQLAALRADPDGLAAGAVDELLRYLSIAHTGARTALEDVELGGHQIKAGDSVAVSIQAANRDPAKYSDPDVLDLRRAATGHLSFGHGVHQCLGQQLARVELRVALPALVTRFPRLRLAVPPDEVPLRHNFDIHGVHALPVTLS